MPGPTMNRIQEVWAYNLEAEMRHIRDLIETYPYIAMVSASLRSALVGNLTVTSRIQSFLG